MVRSSDPTVAPQLEFPSDFVSRSDPTESDRIQYRIYSPGSASGTEHFVKRANRCFPLTSTDHSADVASDHKLVQYRLVFENKLNYH